MLTIGQHHNKIYNSKLLKNCKKKTCNYKTNIQKIEIKENRCNDFYYNKTNIWFK